MSQTATIIAETPAQTFFIEEGEPTETIYIEDQAKSLSAAPAQSVAVTAAASEENCPVAAQLERWADFSPEEVDLGFPDLPEPDYKCYKPPTVPKGQTRYLKVEEGAELKNLEQNFNDVRTAVRENNTHLQRNKTQITQVNRNHNHLLRIVTNENNFEHNLTNKIVRVADTHRQKIENVKGQTRNFKDFKQTQKVENLGCRRSDATFVSDAREEACVAPAISVAPSRAATSVSRPATAVSVSAPSTSTPVKYIQSAVTLSTAPSSSSSGSSSQ